MTRPRGSSGTSDDSADTARDQVCRQLGTVDPAWSLMMLTATLGAWKHVRLPGQDYSSWSQWNRKVRIFIFLRLGCFQARTASDGFFFPSSLLDRSCLLHRFVKNEWRVLSSQTIGVEFASKIIKVGTGARRKRIKLQVRSGLPANDGLQANESTALGYGRY